MRPDARRDPTLRADKQLIECFLVGYNRVTGHEYKVSKWPDEMQSLRPAVDAIATNVQGLTIAIEHTLVQLFSGDKYDADKFWKMFGFLETEPSLKFPEYDIEVYPEVGPVPRRVDIDEIREVIRQWVVSQSGRFTFGESIQQVHGLPFEINVTVIKNETAFGQVFVGRSGMPETFERMIKMALNGKLPKLVSCEASRRILLLEAETNNHTLAGIAKAIEILRPEFLELANVDEVWVADTVSQESGDLRFCKLCPSGMTQRVFVRGTLTAKDSIPLGKTRFLPRQKGLDSKGL